MFRNIKSCRIGKFVSRGSWIHPDRVIDSHEAIVVTKGEVYINEGGVEYHLLPNDVLLMDPGVRHFGYRESTDTEFFWIHWRGEADALRGLKYKKLENTYCIFLYCRQLLTAQIVGKGEEYNDYLTRLFLFELCLDSNQLNSANPIVENAAAWIVANCLEGITEAQVAEYCKYNVDYLNRLFKSVYSRTIKQYIDAKRMEFIKELMLSDHLPLKEVARRSGFLEYKYFLKFFKYHEKISPTEFYKQHAYLSINSH